MESIDCIGLAPCLETEHDSVPSTEAMPICGQDEYGFVCALCGYRSLDCNEQLHHFCGVCLIDTQTEVVSVGWYHSQWAIKSVRTSCPWKAIGKNAFHSRLLKVPHLRILWRLMCCEWSVDCRCNRFHYLRIVYFDTTSKRMVRCGFIFCRNEKMALIMIGTRGCCA